MANESIKDQSCYKDALFRITRFCAYQDRCFSEVRDRLNELEVGPEYISLILEYLVDENYLDEERYLRSIIRGKFLYKGWGKIKIHHFLKSKNISNVLFDKIWEEEVKESNYIEVIKDLVEKKCNALKSKNDFELKQKIIVGLYQKGFESALVGVVIDQFLSDRV